MEITLTLASRPVTMRNCSHCDSRSWHSDGEVLHLPRILELAAKK